MTAKRHKRKHRRRQNTLLLILPAAAAVLVIAVLVALLLAKTKSAGTLAEQDAAEQLAASESAQGAADGQAENSGEAGAENAGAPGSGSEKDGANGDGQESSPDDDTSAGKTEPSGVAAEVGSMDDEEDPQKAKQTSDGSSGASVDVSGLQPGEGETADISLGIDVSKYQGTIDWAKVRDAGVEFAMIRVGYRTESTGIIYEDPGARYNLQEATANGIKAGVYFFSSAVTEAEAKEEADWVKGFIAKYKITYPVAYNCEDFQSPDSRQYELGVSERTKLACAFLDSVAAGGYTPMFYASRNEMEGSAQWDMNTIGSKYKVWVSQYPEKPYPETASSSYSGAHAMWQYTSQGRVDGIKTVVDVNVAYFGYSQEAQAKDPNPAEIVAANPELGIQFTEVDEQVTAKNQTNLRNLPTTEGSQVVYLLTNGEVVQRTGIGGNGWDRVIYNGQKLYAVHNFLTTELTPQGGTSANGSGTAADGTADGGTGAGSGAGNADTASGASSQGAAGTASSGMTFREVNEAVTARDKVNLRDKPSTDTGNVVGTLSYGEAVVRTGVSDSGWSRLEVNGQVVYASSRLLATSMDYKEQEKPTAENPEAGMHFVAAGGTVKAKSGETNLRTLPTTNEPSQVVGQLTGDATAQRVAVDKDKGWTKLNYNGQTVYAVSSYLTVVE